MPSRTTLSATALAAVLCLAASPSATASTIHACVKPKSGATRIVSAKAKCRHGEKKLSWSTTGPRGVSGPAGAPGAPGSPGASGTGPAFLGGGGEAALGESPAVLFTKTIPPGDYVVTAPVMLRAEAAAAKKTAHAACFAVDEPGTSLTTADLSGKTVQLAAIGQWLSPLAEEASTEFLAATTMTLAGALESKLTSTIGLACDDLDSSAGVSVTALLAGLSVTQVSSLTS